MTKIKNSFNRKSFKSGHSHVVSIPDYLIKSGIYDVNKEYEFNFKEVKK